MNITVSEMCPCTFVQYIQIFKNSSLFYSVADPHWFQCGSGYRSGSSIFCQCVPGSRSGYRSVFPMRILILIQPTKMNADPDPNPGPDPQHCFFIADFSSKNQSSGWTFWKVESGRLPSFFFILDFGFKKVCGNLRYTALHCLCAQKSSINIWAVLGHILFSNQHFPTKYCRLSRRTNSQLKN